MKNDASCSRRPDTATLAARQRVLGPDHPDTLASTNNLSEVRRELDELQS